MTYVATVLGDAPAYYWRFADPGGRLFANIGSVIPRPPLYGLLHESYAPYSGVASDGGSIFRTVGDANVQNNGNPMAIGNTWSMEIWNWKAEPNVDMTVMEMAPFPGGAPRMSLFQAANDAVQGFIAGVIAVNYVGPLTRFSWHHFVLTYDHVNLRLYVDGVLRDTQPAVTTTACSASPQAGVAVTNSNQMVGALAEYAIYNVALSGAAVAAHYAAADTKNIAPFWRGDGSGPISVTGTGVLASDLDAQILAAVRKTF